MVELSAERPARPAVEAAVLTSSISSQRARPRRMEVSSATASSRYFSYTQRRVAGSEGKDCRSRARGARPGPCYW